MHKAFRYLAIVATSFSLLSPSAITHAEPINKSIATVRSISAVVTDQSVTIKWSKATSSTRFKISGYKVTASKVGWSSTKRVSAATTSVKFTGLINNQKYSFAVSSISGSYISTPVKQVATPKSATRENRLSFGQPADMYIGAADQQLYASASSSLITFTSLTPTVCSIIGAKVHAKALGDCIIRATSEAGGGYLAAVPIDRLLSIGRPVAEPTRVLLWSDEFDGPAGSNPDSTKWTADTTDGCVSPYNNCGWGNNERQYYLASKNTVDGSAQGVLNINATRQTSSTNYNCYFGKCEWLSGKITTYDRVGFTYGYMESRIKLSAGEGAWPAFWMLGMNIRTVPWPVSGELDIMEFKGTYPRVTYSTVHYANSGGNHTYRGNTKDAMVDLTTDYHRYGMMWKPEEIDFYFDDQLVFSIRKSDTGLAYWPFGPNAQGVQPNFYAIFNLAMGGNFVGSIDPNLSSSTLSVDWVRYYSVDGLGKVNRK